MAKSMVDTVIALTLQGTLLGFAVLILQWAFHTYIPPKFRLSMWFLVFLKLLMPLQLYSPFSVFRVFQFSPGMNHMINSRATSYFNQLPYIAHHVETVGKQASPSPFTDIYGVIFILWAVVTVVLAFAIFHYYYNTKISLFKHKCDDFDKRTMDLAESCFQEAGIPQDTEIIYSSFAHSFYVFGLFKPLIVAPYEICRSLSESELRIALLHEAVHIKKKHYLFKFVALFINILNWFNPFIWFFTAKLDQAMELDCDYYVTKSKNFVEAPDYISALMHVAKYHKRTFAASLSFGKNNFYRRVECIMNGKKLPYAISAITLAAILALSVGFFTLASETKALNAKLEENKQITEELNKNLTADDSKEIGNPTLGQMIDNALDNALRPVTDSLGGEKSGDGGNYDASGFFDGLSDSWDDLYENSIKSDPFWVNRFQKYMSYEELVSLLPSTTHAASQLTKADKLTIDIKGVYAFLEYTDETTIRMEAYEDSAYKTPYTYKITDNAGEVQIFAKPSVPTSHNLSQEPRAVKIFIPNKMNNFADIAFASAMSYSHVYGLTGETLTYDGSMSFDAITDNTVNTLNIQSSMAFLYIDFEAVNRFDYNSTMGSAHIRLGAIQEDSKINDKMGKRIC